MRASIKKNPTKVSRGKNSRKDDECWYKNLDAPAEIALYYGFTPTESPTVTKDDAKKARALSEAELRSKDASDVSARESLEEKVALLRLYNEKNFQNLPQPVMLYFGKPITAEDGTKKSPGKERTIFLEAMGTSKSIAEALLIKTAVEILREEGFEKLSVHINSVGDRDTVSRFGRELSAYYRKNIEELPAHCRQLLKKDVFELLSCKNEKCRIIKNSAPKSMNFLSEDSRNHFKEVLEYLEFLEIPYEIDHFLVRNRSFSCQTLFEIYDPAGKEVCQPLGVGVRYSHIAKKIGMKKDVPGVGVRLSFKEKNAKKNLKFLKPKIYFIQLGFEAKLKSLKIIEILRQAKVPMHHGISRDKLTSQLTTAENMKIPYTLIMGQKEAMEDTVIVRHMTDRSQESVKICDLARCLKKI
ncbi:MAG: His/Gly/Thr/Pro-type tRNA ligase C-terminal domain-containing protein [Patescibacteria group bacterium]